MNPRRLLFLLPFVAACASTAAPLRTDARVATADTRDDADRVVWVRMAGGQANASVVLTGARVQLVAGARQQRGDTLYAKVPFAIALPDSAFELRIATRALARGAAPIAEVEYVTVDARGERLKVRGTGEELLLSRGAPGQQVLLAGKASATFSMMTRAGE